jgi:hypothetical protein
MMRLIERVECSSQFRSEIFDRPIGFSEASWMLPFLWTLALAEPPSVHDIAIGIWSGYECILTRGLFAAETWIRQFPRVHLYSDFFPKNAEEQLRSRAFPSDITFVSLGNCASHLWFPTAWKRAQPRFLRAMVDLFARAPTAKWYLFVDDDSYLFLDNTLAILDRFNFTDKVVVGHFYCAWPQVVFGKHHNMQCMNFPQGGAGMAISHGMLSFLSDKLLDCNDKYNDGEYAGSMRFAKCVGDHVVDGTWRYGDGIQNFKSQFMSRNPIEEIEDNFCNRPPATFHRLTPRDIRFVWRGHRSTWPCGNGSECYADWSHLTGRPFLLFPEERQPLHLRFGFGIALPQSSRVIARATTAIQPDLRDGVPVGYWQEFGEALRIRIVCDANASEGVVQESFENREWMQFTVRVRCPRPRVFDFSLL